MRSNRMGTAGLQVSDLSLGTFEWGRRVDEATARELLDAYASAGGTALELPSFDAPAVSLVAGLRLPSRVQLLARAGVRAEGSGAQLDRKSVVRGEWWYVYIGVVVYDHQV